MCDDRNYPQPVYRNPHRMPVHRYFNIDSKSLIYLYAMVHGIECQVDCGGMSHHGLPLSPAHTSHCSHDPHSCARSVRERILPHPREVVDRRRHQTAEDVPTRERQEEVHPPKVRDGRPAAHKDKGRGARGRMQHPKTLRERDGCRGGEGDGHPFGQDAQEARPAQVEEEDGDARGDEAADDSVPWLGKRARGCAELPMVRAFELEASVE